MPFICDLTPEDRSGYASAAELLEPQIREAEAAVMAHMSDLCSRGIGDERRTALVAIGDLLVAVDYTIGTPPGQT